MGSVDDDGQGMEQDIFSEVICIWVQNVNRM